MVATNAARHAPPNESWSKRVSFEARYGTCFLPSFSAPTTFASAESDWLMDVSSLMRCCEKSLSSYLKGSRARPVRAPFPVVLPASTVRAPCSGGCVQR